MLHYLDWIAETVSENWDKPALTDYSLLSGGEGCDYTYGEMFRQIKAVESFLSAAGLQPGDHIAICGANSANWLITYMAIAAYRGVSVTLLHTQMMDVIASQIAFADCKALFVDTDIWTELGQNNIPGLQQVFSLKNFSVLRGQALPYENNLRISPEDVHFNTGPLEDVAQICFTSGSTEKPKGVMLSFANLTNNVRNAVENFPDGRNMNVLSALPLAHIYGLVGSVLGNLPNGHHIVFIKRISLGVLQEALHEVNPYVLLIVPMLIEQLFSRKGNAVSEMFPTGLKQIFIGGSKMNVDIEDALISLGLPLTTGYGSTETGPLISASRFDAYKPHSSGQVVSGMEVKISDCGEILARGANVMLGYYKDPEATRRKIDAEGWLHTGDRGRVEEDGTLYVYGRMEQDMIVLPSGENIIPQNIEALLNKLNGVAESLVLERSGRLVALVFPEQAHDESPMNRNTILQAINVQLPSFSQLDDIEFVSEPFQRTGKSGIKRYLYS